MSGAPDRIRRHEPILALVRDVFRQGGVVAMICHAGWVPISAGIVEGKTVISVSAIRDDLQNAGASWMDREVVQDGNLISSRSPPGPTRLLPDDRCRPRLGLAAETARGRRLAPGGS
ncbi:MAG: DJ-1/PfpI family protein [Anaerolineae bacterium]